MNRARVISLFSGAGGLDYGFEAAGFETAVTLDLDADACAALRANRPWPVLEGDLGRISTSTILDTAQLRCGEAGLLIGGPPCQPFSKSGYWARGDAARLTDPRAGTLFGYLRVLEEALPEVFLLENVPGIAFSGKSDGVQLIRNRVGAINARQGTNYQVSIACLNAASFGVPQLRHRVFVIGHREGKKFAFPEATHDDISRSTDSLEPYRTAWDALGDLPESNDDHSLRLSGKWAELLPSIPEGSNYLWHTPRGEGLPLFGWRTRYWNFLLKLSRRLPAWTIQAQPGPATGPFHWNNRKLSILELLRLQTFPEDVSLPCNRADAQRLVGNAVPSALAEALALGIGRQYFEQLGDTKPLSLIPVRRNQMPLPRPIAEVPTKYRALIGNHSDHPGTGKGARAAARSNQLSMADIAVFAE
jgi:DNA (cytosine-5)-methyltransferase 1